MWWNTQKLRFEKGNSNASLPAECNHKNTPNCRFVSTGAKFSSEPQTWSSPRKSSNSTFVDMSRLLVPFHSPVSSQCCKYASLSVPNPTLPTRPQPPFLNFKASSSPDPASPSFSSSLPHSSESNPKSPPFKVLSLWSMRSPPSFRKTSSFSSSSPISTLLLSPRVGSKVEPILSPEKSSTVVISEPEQSVTARNDFLKGSSNEQKGTIHKGVFIPSLPLSRCDPPASTPLVSPRRTFSLSHRTDIVEKPLANFAFLSHRAPLTTNGQENNIFLLPTVTPRPSSVSSRDFSATTPISVQVSSSFPVSPPVLFPSPASYSGSPRPHASFAPTTGFPRSNSPLHLKSCMSNHVAHFSPFCFAKVPHTPSCVNVPQKSSCSFRSANSGLSSPFRRRETLPSRVQSTNKFYAKARQPPRRRSISQPTKNLATGYCASGVAPANQSLSRITLVSSAVIYEPFSTQKSNEFFTQKAKNSVAFGAVRPSSALSANLAELQSGQVSSESHKKSHGNTRTRKKPQVLSNSANSKCIFSMSNLFTNLKGNSKTKRFGNKKSTADSTYRIRSLWSSKPARLGLNCRRFVTNSVCYQIDGCRTFPSLQDGKFKGKGGSAFPEVAPAHEKGSHSNDKQQTTDLVTSKFQGGQSSLRLLASRSCTDFVPQRYKSSSSCATVTGWTSQRAYNNNDTKDDKHDGEETASSIAMQRGNSKKERARDSIRTEEASNQSLTNRRENESVRMLSRAQCIGRRRKQLYEVEVFHTIESWKKAHKLARNRKSGLLRSLRQHLQFFTDQQEDKIAPKCFDFSDPDDAKDFTTYYKLLYAEAILKLHVFRWFVMNPEKVPSSWITPLGNTRGDEGKVCPSSSSASFYSSVFTSSSSAQECQSHQEGSSPRSIVSTMATDCRDSYEKEVSTSLISLDCLSNVSGARMITPAAAVENLAETGSEWGEGVGALEESEENFYKWQKLKNRQNKGENLMKNHVEVEEIMEEKRIELEGFEDTRDAKIKELRHTERQRVESVECEDTSQKTSPKSDTTDCELHIENKDSSELEELKDPQVNVSVAEDTRIELGNLQNTGNALRNSMERGAEFGESKETVLELKKSEQPLPKLEKKREKEGLEPSSGCWGNAEVSLQRSVQPVEEHRLSTEVTEDKDIPTLQALPSKSWENSYEDIHVKPLTSHEMKEDEIITDSLPLFGDSIQCRNSESCSSINDSKDAGSCNSVSYTNDSSHNNESSNNNSGIISGVCNSSNSSNSTSTTCCYQDGRNCINERITCNNSFSSSSCCDSSSTISSASCICESDSNSNTCNNSCTSTDSESISNKGSPNDTDESLTPINSNDSSRMFNRHDCGIRDDSKSSSPLFDCEKEKELWISALEQICDQKVKIAIYAIRRRWVPQNCSAFDVEFLSNREWQMLQEVDLRNFAGLQSYLRGTIDFSDAIEILSALPLKCPTTSEAKVGDLRDSASEEQRKDCEDFVEESTRSDNSKEDGLDIITTEAVEALKLLRAKIPHQFYINGWTNCWIIKPSCKSRGRDIELHRNLGEISRFIRRSLYGSHFVCQKYVERPLLIHRRKFDIRQWVLITCWNPLIGTEEFKESTSFIFKRPEGGQADKECTGNYSGHSSWGEQKEKVENK